MELRIEPHRSKGRRRPNGTCPPPVPKVCENCGADYRARYDQADASRFCSAKCRCSYAARVRNSVDQKGENNPNWKGGISTDRVRYTRIQMKRYPERVAARKAALAALKAGKLVRQPCEVCGTTEDVQAHHDDYSKPLVVRWLCRPDHRAHHEAQRAA